MLCFQRSLKSIVKKIPGFRSTILSCHEALFKSGGDTSLCKSPFYFHCHCLGSVSQCHNINRTGVLQGAEPSWYQTISAPAAHAALCALGPARAAVAGRGATCSPNLLPGHPISLSSPSLGWHLLQFPQQCSWEMGKSGEVFWLQTRLYLIFCRLQLIP